MKRLRFPWIVATVSFAIGIYGIVIDNGLLSGIAMGIVFLIAMSVAGRSNSLL